MTRLEALRMGTPKEIAQILCDLVEEYSMDTELEMEKGGGWIFPHVCAGCPAKKHCGIGSNGFISWLEEEMEG